MPPPLDEDDQDNDPESDPDEEEYLSDEVLNENDFIIDPYFYQKVISEIEVRIYNPRLPKPGDWPVDPPSFPMPPKVHPNPLPIIDDNEPHHQASVKAFTVQDTSSSLMPIQLKDNQGDTLLPYTQKTQMVSGSLLQCHHPWMTMIKTMMQNQILMKKNTFQMRY